MSKEKISKIFKKQFKYHIFFASAEIVNIQIKKLIKEQTFRNGQ